MRVLFVNRMASMVRGGGETFDLEIARHLELLGCETSFLTGIPLFSNARTPVASPRAYSVRTPYFGWFPWDKVRGGWRLRLADFYLFEKAAARWVDARKDQFDVVQVCELPTFVAEVKKLGVTLPVVMRMTAPDYYDAGGALHQADAVIASGATMEKLKGARADCVDIPNGVDAELFQPHASVFRKSIGIPEEDFVILFVGRFQAVKNHAMLVDAFARLLPQCPRARLVLAGSGPLEGRIRARCRAAGIARRVMFLGEVPFRDLPDVYAAADLKVITSDYESFCFAALEAMATALPLVVTDTDWVPKLIGHGEGGLVVGRNDANGLAEALASLMDDAPRRAVMGRRNREIVVREYQWKNSAARRAGLYRDLLERRA